MNLASIPRESKDVPLGLIDDPELPSRTEMADAPMAELVSSIREHGLIQPLVLVRVGDRFEVLAGHRRKIACERAGLVAAPAVIYPTKSTALVAIQYAENRFREDLNPADEAFLFAELLERDCGGDVDVLCAKLGEKRGYVEGRLILLRDAKILDALRPPTELKVGIALHLLKVTDPLMRHYFLDAAIRGGATNSVVAGWVQDWQATMRHQHGEAPTTAPAAAPGAVAQTDYFRCAVCQGTENVHLMVPVNVHSDCKTAILDKLLATYRGDA